MIPVTQRQREPKEVIIPVVEPKKNLKKALVYPIRAEISNFRRMRIRERSIGFARIITKEKVSKGYWRNTMKQIRNIPSNITAINNHVKIAKLKPLILFS